MKKWILTLVFAFVLAAPAAAFDTGVAGKPNTVSLSQHAAVIDTSGSLWMWGDNSYGQLGNGGQGNQSYGFADDPTPYQSEPVKIMDDVVSVSTGPDVTAAIKKDGSLWMWGNNGSYNLGNGGGGNGTGPFGFPTQTDPVQIIGSGVAAVSVGASHTAAIKTDGSLWVWGYNGAGQLGNDLEGDKYSRDLTALQSVPLKLMDNVSAVCAGGNFTAVIKTDGSLWTWGSNGNGQLGNGGTGNERLEKRGYGQSVPVKIMDGVSFVNLGSNTAAAIKKDGSLWMWGNNYYGQLGNQGRGNMTGESEQVCQSVPVKVMDNVADVKAGSYQSAAVKTDGSLWTWGENAAAGIATTEALYSKPLKIQEGVASIYLWDHINAAVRTDGSLWMWGKGRYGLLGGDKWLMEQAAPVQVPQLQVKTVS